MSSPGLVERLRNALVGIRSECIKVIKGQETFFPVDRVEAFCTAEINAAEALARLATGGEVDGLRHEVDILNEMVVDRDNALAAANAAREASEEDGADRVRDLLEREDAWKRAEARLAVVETALADAISTVRSIRGDVPDEWLAALNLKTEAGS